ncbi:hypothetical protein RHECNPAF_1260061 [Rhizobium etli CNPAF512]|nr:hypothetical protein RHECNPAF_1260061 [Rhizobium etli CNPAF512]
MGGSFDRSPAPLTNRNLKYIKIIEFIFKFSGTSCCEKVGRVENCDRLRSHEPGQRAMTWG